MTKENFLDQDEVLKVLKVLIGNIKPHGASHIDNDRKVNLEIFLEVFDEMHTMIDEIIYENLEVKLSSVEEMVKMCENKLDRLGFTGGE